MCQKKTRLSHITLLIMLLVGYNSMVLAGSYECSKAISAAKQSLALDDKYDRFLGIEALDRVGLPIDTDFLLTAIDPLFPFLSHSAISAISAINKISLTDKLIRNAETNDEISSLLIGNLQHETMDGVESFIRGYLRSHTNKFELIKGIKAVAVSANGSLGEDLKVNYKNYSHDELVKAYALYAIVRLNIEFEDAKKEAITLANSPDPLAREMAGVILGELGGEDAVELLKVLMNDDIPRVSIAALASFLKITNGSEKERFITLLKSKSILNAESAAGSLKRLPGWLAMEIVEKSSIEMLNIKVSLRIIESIAALESTNATATFNWGLAHQEEDVVIQTLFAIGNRSLLLERELLIPFLESENTSLRSIASWAYLKKPC